MYMQRKKRAVMLGESVTALAIAALSIVLFNDWPK